MLAPTIRRTSLASVPLILVVLAGAGGCSSGNAGSSTGWDPNGAASPPSDTDSTKPADGGTKDGPNEGKGDAAGPRILSFGTNVSTITEGQSVRFVAVVTHPAGLDKLVGGQLTSPDGAIKYGAFVADQQGTYSLELTWLQLNQAEAIAFAGPGSRALQATFFDVAGATTAKDASVGLTCTKPGSIKPGACAGVCVDFASWANCGACGKNCGTFGRCNAGKCSSFDSCQTDRTKSCATICAAAGKTCVAECGNQDRTKYATAVSGSGPNDCSSYDSEASPSTSANVCSVPVSQLFTTATSYACCCR